MSFKKKERKEKKRKETKKKKAISNPRPDNLTTRFATKKLLIERRLVREISSSNAQELLR